MLHLEYITSMATYTIATNNYNDTNIILTIPTLERCVAITPPHDVRGVMTCDCQAGDLCDKHEHWLNRWVFVQLNHNGHLTTCDCHDCVCCNEFGCYCGE